MMTTITGYKGGIEHLIKESNVSKEAFISKGIKSGVLHVGGTNRHHQYKYTSFMHPIVRRAVDGGANQLVYMLTEGSQSTSKKIPCCALVGDYQHVCEYVRVMTEHKPYLGVYYYHFNPSDTKPSAVKAFMDFDIICDNDEPWQTSWINVSKAIDIVSEGFVSNSSTQGDEKDIDNEHSFNLDYVVAYGARLLPSGQMKHSYHVTWQQQGFASQQDQCNFMKTLLNGNNIDYDSKVYSNGRLMRVPWCGKCGDSSAKLYPTTFTLDDEGGWTNKVTHSAFDTEMFKKFNITPYKWDMDKIKFHSCQLHENQHNIKRIGMARTINNLDIDDRFVFMEPLMNWEVLPKIQLHRRNLLDQVQSKGFAMGAGVPVENYTVTNWERSTRFSGQYMIRVVGDTFCEYDTSGATPYHHTTDKIKICVDLQHGTYRQLCYTCNGSSNVYSIFDVNCITISAQTESSPRVLDIAKKKGAHLIMKYFADDIIFNPTINSEFVVYDEKTKLWCAEKHSMYMIMAKCIQFEKKYRDYRVAVWADNFDYRLRRCEGDEKKIEKLMKERYHLQTIDVVGSTTSELMIKDMKGVYKEVIGKFSDVVFNNHKELVPLNDGTCYNVITDRTITRTKEMYFTSQLSDVLKNNTRDDECKQIKDWFLEIAKGRLDLALYLKRLFGLVMTSLDIDRHFYVFLGVMGRNGKSVAFEMLEVTNTLLFL